MQGWSGNVGCARAFSTARSVVLGTCLAACLCVPLSAIAQQPGTAATPPVAGRTTAASPARTTTAKAAATKAETAAAAPASEAGLRQRIEQLEEQLVEMQVTIGTLDSLAKGGGSSSSGVYRGGGNNESSGGDPARVAALETQVRALAAQVDQLTVQIRQLNARGSTAPTPVANTVPLAPAATEPADPIGRLVTNGASGTAAGSSLPSAAASDASAKQSYETAYGFLLQQDFASAETAFDDFLKRFPNDPLAGNAQYWLGETFFVRGQYKGAAAAFLKGYQTYARSAKAPDSVLKLAMSLDKLGQKDAACASYAELNTKFPNAPGHVKNRADTERKRLGCA